MDKIDFDIFLSRRFFQQQISIAENICLYAWHCNQHLQHILQLKQREN